MTNAGRCLRPSCPLTPRPELTGANGLRVRAYCSAACQVWCEAAVRLATATFIPAIEWESEQLYKIGQFLNTRESADDVEMRVHA